MHQAMSAKALADGAWTSLGRIVAPLTGLAYTEVEVDPGNGEVPRGRDAEVRAQFSGRRPREAVFRWRWESEEDWHTERLAPDRQGACTLTIKEVREPLLYQVAGRDALSAQYRIAPYDPPAVEELQVALHYPGYTRLPPATNASPNLSAVRGTQADFRLQPTTNLLHARLLFEQSPPLYLNPNQDGSWTGSLTVTNSTGYWIELLDEKGRCAANAEPYHIEALPDRPPTVDIVQPGTDIRANATDTIQLNDGVDASRFEELAGRQMEAGSFGEIYLGGLRSEGAPASAIEEMETAIDDMAKAVAALKREARNDALRFEENALRHLYRVVQLLPELGDLPVQRPRGEGEGAFSGQPGGMLQVILETIRKKKPLPDTREIEDLVRDLEMSGPICSDCLTKNEPDRVRQQTKLAVADARPDGRRLGRVLELPLCCGQAHSKDQAVPAHLAAARDCPGHVLAARPTESPEAGATGTG